MKHSGFESSMTDLMISLVVLFLLIISAVALQMKYAQKKPISRVEEIMKTLKRELDQKTQELQIPGLVIEKAPDDNLAFIVIVPEKNLKFEYNKFELNDENKIFLSNIMPIIVSVTIKHQEYIDFIKIEGYTDQSGGMDGMGNILLSQNRALSVLNYTLQGVLMGDNRTFLLDKTSVSGYGSLHLAQTDSESRRVIIKVRVKSLELNEEFKNKLNRSDLKVSVNDK